MPKKVLIVAYSMDVGGVERALLGLLSNINYSEMSVTLRLARKKGELMNEIPKQVRVEEIESISNNWNLFTKPLLPQILACLSTLQHFVKGVRLLYDYICFKFFGHYHTLFNHICQGDVCQEEFDLAISYAGPSSLLDYYIVNCVKSKKKVAWIHFDVDKCGINNKSEEKLYKEFDKIYVVSEEGKRRFDLMFPEVSFKSEVFHNLINAKKIRESAQAQSSNSIFHEGCVNIAVVGRLSKEKGQNRALEALSILVKRNYNVFLTLVGGGLYESDLREMADRLGVTDRIYISGVTTNPYPYMANCDIYLQPSLHEGFCITLAEAKLFGMPIVATEFTGAQEQLSDYRQGFVVGHDSRLIADSLAQIIDKGLYLRKFPEETTETDYKKIEALL